MILDQSIDSTFQQETLPIEFTQSFMQLVTESDEDIVFYSEKTATPILLNKPFLVASCVNFHKSLEQRGFQLYTELFDYGFDSESDIVLRYEGLIENVKRISMLSKQQLEILHKQIFEKLVFNKQHAMNLINNIPEQVQSLLQLIREENKEPYPGPLNILL